MKQYFITTKEFAEKHAHCFCPKDGSHFIDLPSGEILIAVNFHSEATEEHWHGMAGPGAHEPLPHPMWDGNEPIKPHHHDKLKHLGGLSTMKAPTVHDVAHHAGQRHPLMRLRRFSKS